MKVSVVVPVYNGEKTIIKTLKTLKNQSFNDFEVIIIDDGSIDTTSTIVKKVTENDDRFQYFHQLNQGVSVARNKGIDMASGKYIWFLDADDFYNNDFLEKMYSEISQTNSDLCFCGYNIVENDVLYPKKMKFATDKLLKKYFLGKISVGSSGWMIKKSLINKENIKFIEGVSWGEDIEFFSEVISLARKKCFVSEYLTNYVISHDDNQLSSFSIDKLDKDFESIMRLINNDNIKKDKEIFNSLLGYRLPALLVYRLLEAINLNIDIDVVRNYYLKYEDHIKSNKFNNGLRSIKLLAHKIKLDKKLF